MRIAFTALLLSAAWIMPIRGTQSKPAASLVTAVKLTSAVSGDGSLNYRRFTDAGWEMSESIRKIRQVIFALKAHSHTGRDVVGGIVGASEFAIVVSVHGNTVVK